MAIKKAGEIVLFKFPDTDLLQGKLRPALLLAPVPSAYADWLICMISSQLNQAIQDIDDIILDTDHDFSGSGLKMKSVVRVTRLAVVSESIFLGRLGEISTDRLNRIKNNLACWITKSK